MKIEFSVEVEEMTNGFLDFKFDVFFTLRINDELIFENRDRIEAIIRIDKLLYGKQTIEKIKEKMYEGMHDSISQICFTRKYEYILNEVNL